MGVSEEIRKEITEDLTKIVGEYMEKRGGEEGLTVCVQILDEADRKRKTIFADKDYAPIHKTFLTDYVVHGITLRALIETCKEKHFDFSDRMLVHGRDTDPWAMIEIYDHLREFVEESVTYVGKGISHKDLARRVFKKTRNKRDAMLLMNQIKAVTGLFCDDDERERLIEGFLEDMERGEDDGE